MQGKILNKHERVEIFSDEDFWENEEEGERNIPFENVGLEFQFKFLGMDKRQ